MSKKSYLDLDNLYPNLYISEHNEARILPGHENKTVKIVPAEPDDNEYLACEPRADISFEEEEIPMFDQVDAPAEAYVRIQPFDGNHFMIRLTDPLVNEITLVMSAIADGQATGTSRVFREIPAMKKHTRGAFNLDERIFFEVEE